MDTLATNIVHGLGGTVPAWVVPVLTIVGIYIRHFEKRRMERKAQQQP